MLTLRRGQGAKVSRRGVMASGLAAVGTASMGGVHAGLAAEPGTGRGDLAGLARQFGIKGPVLGTADAGFSDLVLGEQWNRLMPARRPAAVARVVNDADVVAAVRFARANDLKVAVRGGGHNWCSPALRNGGLLIDLSSLNRIVSVDAGARRAVLQPVVSNRDIQATLNPLGLAFPTGHCPTVKASGYLLSGGMSWNHGVWGPGVGSVEAIDLVTARGEMITASATENTDYFWAARGAGPGFFGVAVRYHVRLHPLPRAIMGSVYTYPYEHIVELGRWLDQLAPKLPPSVELSLWTVQAPPELAGAAGGSNGKVAMVTATLFADTTEGAQTTLRALDSYPSLGKCLAKSVAQPTSFPELFDASGSLWPPNLRSRVGALFSDAPLGQVMQALQGHLHLTPSPKSVFMLAVYTGPSNGPAVPADAAFSMTARLYGGPWTMWDSAVDDAANLAWHERCVDLIDPLVKGHYIGETDIVGHPERARLAYSAANWQRLAELRRVHDPDGLFFGFADGLGA